MSRFFFHILTDPGDGNLEFDTSVAAGNFTADLDGSPSGLSFTQSGDGYYFDYTVTGQYTIKISGVAQDEFTTVPLIATEDNIDTTMLQSVKGYIYSSGGYLRVYTDGSSAILHAGDIVNDLTTGGSTKVLSAEQGKTLYQKILAITGAGGNGTASRRVVFSESLAATASAGNEAAAFTEYPETAGSEKIKRRFAFYKNPEDKVLIVLCQVKTAGGSDGYVILSVDGNFNNEADVSSSITDWTDFSHTEDISAVDAGLHEVTIGIQISSGSGTMYARKITVIAGPY